MTEPDLKSLPVLFQMTDLERMAESMVKSKLFGVKTIDEAVALMLLAQAEGLHPATAARDYHIIQGRPSMKADAMLARFQKAGGIVEWHDYTDTKVSGAFRHPSSPKPVMVEWTIEMARKIGLAGKDTWKNYPRQMLRARVISEGVRTCYPAIATGIYTSEEVHDFEKDITPTAGVLGSLTANRQEIINETAAQIREYMANDRPMDAYGLIDAGGFDADEQVALWSLLDSKQRSALKRINDADKAAKTGKISQAQHKRLEARITELGIDREALKRHCADKYGISHFTELMGDQYQDLDAELESLVSGTKTAAPERAAIEHDQLRAQAPSAASLISSEQAKQLGMALYSFGVQTADFLKAAKVDRLESIAAIDFEKALKWINKHAVQTDTGLG